LTFLHPNVICAAGSPWLSTTGDALALRTKVHEVGKTSWCHGEGKIREGRFKTEEDCLMELR
jgi:hypothetical protein